MASKLSCLPMTPIVGSALIRYGFQTCQFFDVDLANSMPYRSSVFVPIVLPSSYEKFLKSAAKRALGPAGDSLERSGVEYQIRTIGARGSAQDSGQDKDDEEKSEDDEDDVFDAGVPGVSPPLRASHLGKETLLFVVALQTN